MTPIPPRWVLGELSLKHRRAVIYSEKVNSTNRDKTRPTGERRCRYCLEAKPIREMKKNKNRPMGATTVCLKCSAARRRKPGIVREPVQTFLPFMSPHRRWSRRTEARKKRGVWYRQVYEGEQRRKKKRQEPLVKFKARVRKRVQVGLKRLGTRVRQPLKEGSLWRRLGYTPEALAVHLSQYLGKPCPDCGEVVLEIGNVDVEHAIPLSWAKDEEQVIALNQLANLRLTCKPCNRKKWVKAVRLPGVAISIQTPMEGRWRKADWRETRKRYRQRQRQENPNKWRTARRESRKRREKRQRQRLLLFFMEIFRIQNRGPDGVPR
jgi:hypothetical protein